MENDYFLEVKKIAIIIQKEKCIYEDNSQAIMQL